MQPSKEGREVKTIRGCPSDKDLKSPKVSRYSLTTQTQDNEGELETKIFKVYYILYSKFIDSRYFCVNLRWPILTF